MYIFSNLVLEQNLSKTIFFAPGKLVIAGDYAILDGAPAISIAVNRGVKCIVSSGQGIVTPTGDKRFVQPALSGLETERRFVFEDENPVSDIPENQVLVGHPQHVSWHVWRLVDQQMMHWIFTDTCKDLVQESMS